MHKQRIVSAIDQLSTIGYDRIILSTENNRLYISVFCDGGYGSSYISDVDGTFCVETDIRELRTLIGSFNDEELDLKIENGLINIKQGRKKGKISCRVSDVKKIGIEFEYFSDISAGSISSLLSKVSAYIDSGDLRSSFSYIHNNNDGCFSASNTALVYSKESLFNGKNVSFSMNFVKFLSKIDKNTILSVYFNEKADKTAFIRLKNDDFDYIFPCFSIKQPKIDGILLNLPKNSILLDNPDSISRSLSATKSEKTRLYKNGDKLVISSISGTLEYEESIDTDCSLDFDITIRSNLFYEALKLFGGEGVYMKVFDTYQSKPIILQNEELTQALSIYIGT